MAENYVNIRTILSRILDHPLLSDMDISKAVTYAVDFMQLVGVPMIFEDKLLQATISNYRVALPTDYYEMNQVRNNNGYLTYATGSFNNSTNSLYKNNSSNTYYISNGYIYFNTSDGNVEISYMAIPVDTDGLPLLPGDSNFLLALEAYIKVKRFTILYDLGKISAQVFNQAKQDYAFAVGSCATNYQKLSLDKAQALTNQWTSLLTHGNNFYNGFSLNGVD